MAAKPATTSAQPGQSAARLWRLVIIVAVIVAFGRACAADFVAWDDPFNLYENRRLNPPGFSQVGHYWANAAHGLYIPITYTVWAGLAALTNGAPDAEGISMNPWVFHGFNVLLHLASAVMVFTLLTRFLARVPAAIGALVFALHPLQVEPVAWAAGMKDVLSGLLVLVALWQYIEFARACQRDKGSAISQEITAQDAVAPSLAAGVHYFIALAAFVLAMLAKPSAMVAPALAMVIDVWLQRRPIRTIAAALAPWFALSLVCAVIARRAQVIGGFDPAPLWARPFVAGDAVSFYLYKLAWPIPLAIDYGRTPSGIMGHWSFFATWLIPAVIAVLLWMNRRHWPQLFIAGAIFVIALSPVLGLVTFQFQYLSTVADHYAYIAMLGPALAAAWLFDLASRRVAKGTVIAATAIVLIALGVRSFLQVAVWQDSVTLFSQAVRVNPSSTICLTNLGRAWAFRGDAARAEALFRRAIDVDPGSWLARENLAALLEAQGRFQEAVEHRTVSLEVMRRHERSAEAAQIPMTAGALARDLALLGRYDEAGKYLQLALEYAPNDPAVLAVVEEVQRRASSGSTLPSNQP